MIKVLLLIAVIAIGLLLIPGLNSKANATQLSSIHTTKTAGSPEKLKAASGLGFAIAAIMKFWQHKNNPTQEPIIHPIPVLKHQLPHIDINEK